MATKKKTGTLAIPGAAPIDDIRLDAPLALDIAAKPSRATINLTVDDALKWSFKEWCTRHRLSQVDAFREAFEMLQAKHGR